MDMQQRKYLNQRVMGVSLSEKKYPVPAEVAKARKIVDLYDRSVREDYSIRRKAMEAAKTKAREAILFMSAGDALKIIRDLEKEKF